VTGPVQVHLHPLQMRADGDTWVVGRVETGDFIAVPQVGHRAITLLAAGRTVDEVRRALSAEGGHDIDVGDFVAGLVELGFVSELDGRTPQQPRVVEPTWPWLRPGHVRWLLSSATAGTVAAVVLAAAVCVLTGAVPLPGYHDLLWSSSGGAVILGNAAIAWTLILIHETAHLATARGAQVPGRISFSTRLQFLVVQTDVSGVWVAPRRARLTVYLAGIAANLVAAALCLLVLAAVRPAPDELAYRLLLATVVLSVALIPAQFLVFLRTDVYFVIQDLTGCANLQADGLAYARYLVSRVWTSAADPSRCLSARERRAVRAYSLVLVVGTTACLAFAGLVTLPAAATLVAGKVALIAGGGSTAGLFDAAATLAVTGLLAVLWTRAWWRRHGRRSTGGR
jgi:putative peptide zinc metalloprotease protein